MARMTQNLDIQNGAVYAKSTLRKGDKFGPYLMRCIDEPHDKNFAWEVSFQCAYTKSV